jgi:hypothetical protein
LEEIMKRISSLTVAVVLLAGAIMFNQPVSRAAVGSDLLQFLPDASGAAVIDVQRLLASPVWAAISAQEKVRGQLEKINADVAELGITLNDINTVAIGFSHPGAQGATVAVNGSFDQSTIVSKLRANAKVKLTAEKYKDFDVTTVEDARANDPKAGAVKEAFSFVFFDPRTAVVGTRDTVRASIDTKLGTKPSIAQNTSLTEALNQNPGAPIHFAMNMTPAMTSKIKSGDFPLPDLSSIKMIWATVDVTSSIDLLATLRNDSAEHARNIADRLNGLLGMVRGFLGAAADPKMSQLSETLKSVNIVDADVDVRITATISLDLLKSLLGIADSTGAARKP